MVLIKELLKRKPGLTTGEVMKMLGIPRGMVVKFFMQGILKGWKHPATGRMFIDPESVKTLKQIWAMTTVTQKEG
jgi:hypothetical protein